MRRGLCLGAGGDAGGDADGKAAAAAEAAEDPEARCAPAFLDRSFSHPWAALKVRPLYYYYYYRPPPFGQWD